MFLPMRGLPQLCLNSGLRTSIPPSARTHFRRSITPTYLAIRSAGPNCRPGGLRPGMSWLTCSSFRWINRILRLRGTGQSLKRTLNFPLLNVPSMPWRKSTAPWAIPRPRNASTSRYSVTIRRPISPDESGNDWAFGTTCRPTHSRWQRKTTNSRFSDGSAVRIAVH